MATVVRIYKPAKTAMQSGQGNSKLWVLEFETSDRQRNEPLMGWVAAADTRRQVKLRFPSKQEAVAYARRQGWVPRVEEPHVRRAQPKSYADNFAFNRII